MSSHHIEAQRLNLKGPLLRLAKNASGTWVAQGKDEALVWYMDYYREAIQEARSRRTWGKKK